MTKILTGLLLVRTATPEEGIIYVDSALQQDQRSVLLAPQREPGAPLRGSWISLTVEHEDDPIAWWKAVDRLAHRPEGFPGGAPDVIILEGFERFLSTFPGPNTLAGWKSTLEGTGLAVVLTWPLEEPVPQEVQAFFRELPVGDDSR
jgi:hypothetical protein